MKSVVESPELQHISPAYSLVQYFKTFYGYECESVVSVKSWALL